MCVRFKCFYKNDILEPQHYISVQKIFQNECARVIGRRNNIVVRTGEEARVSAGIRDGTVQSPVSRKFAQICIKEESANINLKEFAWKYLVVCPAPCNRLTNRFGTQCSYAYAHRQANMRFLVQSMDAGLIMILCSCWNGDTQALLSQAALNKSKNISCSP